MMMKRRDLALSTPSRTTSPSSRNAAPPWRAAAERSTRTSARGQHGAWMWAGLITALSALSACDIQIKDFGDEAANGASEGSSGGADEGVMSASSTSGGTGGSTGVGSDTGLVSSTGSADTGLVSSTGFADTGWTSSTGSADTGLVSSTGSADTGWTSSTGSADTGSADTGWTSSTGATTVAVTSSTGIETSSSTGGILDLTACESTGGTWDLDRCTHSFCGRIPDVECRVLTGGCICGPDEVFVHGTGCVIDDDCDAMGSNEVTCIETGGVWDPRACGNYTCGAAADCDAIVPGCDCGPEANYVDGEGCVPDATCSVSADERRCAGTGGTWDPGSCGHYECGEVPACLALIPGCDCGDGQSFDDELGCYEDQRCLD